MKVGGCLYHHPLHRILNGISSPAIYNHTRSVSLGHRRESHFGGNYNAPVL